MTSFQSVLRSIFIFPSRVALRKMFAFYLCLFLFYFAFLSSHSAHFSVLSNFLAPFSLLALYILLLAFFGHSPSLFPAYFHSNPFSTNLNYNNFLRLKSFSFAGIVALRVDQKSQNTENYRSTTTTPVLFPTQNAGCELSAYAASHLPAHVKPSCNAWPCARRTQH